MSLLSGLAKLFIGRKIKKQFQKAYEVMKDDPELQSAVADMENYPERLDNILESLCKRNPDHPVCKERKLKR